MTTFSDHAKCNYFKLGSKNGQKLAHTNFPSNFMYGLQQGLIFKINNEGKSQEYNFTRWCVTLICSLYLLSFRPSSTLIWNTRHVWKVPHLRYFKHRFTFETLCITYMNLIVFKVQRYLTYFEFFYWRSFWRY